MKNYLLALFSSLSFYASFAQSVLTHFTGCPSVNTAIIRSGTNESISNPFYIYKLNNGNGNPSLISGPILDPANTSVNLQINGVGLNSGDGYLYGLNAGIPTIPLTFPIVPVFPFYRLGANAVAEELGTITGPATIFPENGSIVNPAAGEVDGFGNYYFTATTGVGFPDFANPATSTFTVSRLFLGKLSGIISLPAGTSALSPVYTTITNPSGDASAFLASLYTSNTLSTAQNTGLRDLVYNGYDNDLYTYVTFPIGLNYYGQMLKVDPATGVLSAIAPPVILPFASASNEVAGISISVNGNMIILFTNGNLYKGDKLPHNIYDGSITLFNDATGFPTTLRGDLASCGSPSNGPLPVILTNFNAYKQSSGVVINWETSSEVNINKFIVETSIDAVNWVNFSETTPRGSQNGTTYRVVNNNNLNNTMYYRLAIVDINGSIRYSDIKKINSDNFSFDFDAYPNPVRDMVTIESDHAFTPKSNIMLIDVMGKTYRVTSKKIAENSITLNMASYNKGVYYIHVTMEDGTIATKRVIKL